MRALTLRNHAQWQSHHAWNCRSAANYAIALGSGSTNDTGSPAPVDEKLTFCRDHGEGKPMAPTKAPTAAPPSKRIRYEE